MTDVGALAWLWVVLMALAVFLAIAWLLVPVMLIGVKPLLRRMVEQQQRTNELLEALREAARAERK